MNPRVFIIEDVPEMADLIALYVNNNDMEARVFSNAEDAWNALPKLLPQAVLLDLNLPGMSGIEFLTKFRDMYKTTIPVIIVSARDNDEDIIEGLNIGADEFVTKPFSPRVLVARLKTNIRRLRETEAAVESSVSFGDFVLLENSCVLKKGTMKIPLSEREFEVLDFLVRNAGKNLSPESIYNAVWKVKFGDMTAVAVYIQRLRKKIEKDPSKPKYIRTTFRYGYRFEVPTRTNK